MLHLAICPTAFTTPAGLQILCLYCCTKCAYLCQQITKIAGLGLEEED